MAIAIEKNLMRNRRTRKYLLRDALTDYSPEEASWDKHRSRAQDVSDLYAASKEFERFSARMKLCSVVLRYSYRVVTDACNHVSSLKLRQVQFCRVRHCPVCQWRRSLMWLARFFQALPRLLEEHPSHRWIFLTLTVRNCKIDELSVTLKAMNEAWQRFVKRKEFAHVSGWIRSTEVTRGKDGSAHPHFHVLMIVPSSMVSGRSYIKHAKWVELWRSSLRLDYDPIVNVKAIKDQPDDKVDESGIRSAAAETLKYSVKPTDMVEDVDWFFEMTRQVHKKRFLASGGILKDVLRARDQSDDDLALTSGHLTKQRTRLYAFNWREKDRQYRRFRQGDV